VATTDVRTAPFPEALLGGGGVDVDDFFASYWRRRYLHCPGGGLGLLHLMPSIAEVQAIVDAPAHPDTAVAHFIAFPVDGNPAARSWSVGVEPARPRDRSEPVNLLPADRWFPGLYPLSAALERAFDAPASLQLFLGPPGGGLAPHRDQNDSFVIQIVGSKRWRVADITDERPTVSGIAGGELPADPLVFELEPGDVLYKPSHSVHATESSDTTTLSLTCSIQTRTAGEALLELLGDRLEADPAWLERLPLLGGARGSDDDAARLRIEAALGELADEVPTLADLEQRARS